MNRVLFALSAIFSFTFANALSAQEESAWRTFCTSEARNAPAICIMEQTITLQETGQQFASMRVVSDGKQPPNLILNLPLGVSIQQGVFLKIDELSAQEIPLTTCESDGCFASKPLSETLGASLRAGSVAVASFQNLATQEITVEFSLVGFTAALERLR